MYLCLRVVESVTEKTKDCGWHIDGVKLNYQHL